MGRFRREPRKRGPVRGCVTMDILLDVVKAALFALDRSFEESLVFLTLWKAKREAVFHGHWRFLLRSACTLLFASSTSSAADTFATACLKFSAARAFCCDAACSASTRLSLRSSIFASSFASVFSSLNNFLESLLALCSLNPFDAVQHAANTSAQLFVVLLLRRSRTQRDPSTGPHRRLRRRAATRG